MNITNYYLTEDGIINRLDTYWDKLKDLTNKMEDLSKNVLRYLFGSFSVGLLMVSLIFWLDLPRQSSLIFLSLISLIVLSVALLQFANYLELRAVKKRGYILYKELSKEFDQYYSYDDFDEMPVEEKIILNNFLLACELPINHYLYLSLLTLMPIVHFSLFLFYYFWLR
jgi:hypothetical protein